MIPPPGSDLSPSPGSFGGAPDLSPLGIRRIVNALHSEGVQVFWSDETDHETYVDLHLRAVDSDPLLTLSWRGATGWVLTLHAEPRRDWKIDAADLGDLADQVASITEDL